MRRTLPWASCFVTGLAALPALALTASPRLAPPAAARAPWLALDSGARPDGLLEVQANGSWVFLGAARLQGERAVTVVTREAAAQAALAFVDELAGYRLGAAGLRVLAVQDVGEDRVVQLSQSVGGVPILGAGGPVLVTPSGVRYSSTRFVATPAIDVRPLVRASVAGEEAVLDLRQSTAQASRRGEPTLAITFVDDAAHLVWAVTVTTLGPAATWRVLVDARVGGVVERRRISVDDVQGSVSFKVEPTCQGEGTANLRMPNIEWTSGAFAKDDGSFASTASVSTASIRLASPYFALDNQAGPLAGPWSLPVVAAPAVNDLVVTTAPLDQADPFYHVHKVRAWLRARVDGNNSQTQWTEAQVPVYINIPEHCNAYYDGTLNFFEAGYSADAGATCNNTGQVAGIVYHEYGHSIHDHSQGITNDNDGIMLSEGISDYTAATITGDPNMRGLLAGNCAWAFRTCENEYSYCTSGCTFGPGTEPHDGGMALSGALWDLRAALVKRYGPDLGVATADRLFLKFLMLVSSMGTAYTAMVAADDDTDGNAANGTTHSCEINQAFANSDPTGKPPHFPDYVSGVPSTPSAKFVHHAPGRVEVDAGATPTLEFFAKIDVGCAQGQDLEDVTLHYATPDGVAHERPLSKVDSGPEGDHYQAVLDDLAAPVTVTYYLTAELAGTQLIYPAQGTTAHTTGWPFYRQTARFARETTLYFSDFEADDGGLTTGVVEGAVASDWQWGEPTDIGGDPGSAVSGSHVWGTDLGGDGDGLYELGAVTYVELPVLDASTLKEVRLQFWRKLLNADVAKIEVNGHRAFENRAGAFYWRDPDWVFQDLDISTWAAGESEVHIRFIMADAFNTAADPSSATPELGGWNLDDLRVSGILANDPGGTSGGTGGEGSANLTPDGTAALVGTSCAATEPSLGLFLAALLVVALRRRSGV